MRKLVLSTFIAQRTVEVSTLQDGFTPGQYISAIDGGPLDGTVEKTSSPEAARATHKTLIAQARAAQKS